MNENKTKQNKKRERERRRNEKFIEIRYNTLHSSYINKNHEPFNFINSSKHIRIEERTFEIPFNKNLI